MNQSARNPKITTEISADKGSILLVGDKSSLYPSLREILVSKGASVNENEGFNYLFQLGEFEKVNVLLKKATAAGAKFFLIINQDEENKFSGKAEKTLLKFLQTEKLDAKVIKLSGFQNEEIEAVRKILKVAFSQNKEKIISLVGPAGFWPKEKRGRNFSFFPGQKFFSRLVIALALLLITLPLTYTLANIFLGGWKLKKTQEAVFASDFGKGEREAQAAQDHFSVAENSLTKLTPVFALFGQENKAVEINYWLRVGKDLSRASRYLIKVGQEGQKVARLFLNQEPGNPEEILNKMTADLNLAEEELALVEARAENPPFFKDKFRQIKILRKNLVKLKNFLGIAPLVLGNRTYLLLFQNDMELRPGGGFIGTIGLLTLRDSKMELKVEDVYTADGQLKGHVEPPKAIKIHLDQIHWYLRDSNWDPDFPANAQRAAWFLEKEIGINPDGVIALDLNFVQKILKLTGPIDLPDYQEKIDSENLFPKAQLYTQGDFFPGSTQKRDFLGSLTNALFAKVTADKNFSWFGLGQAINESFEEKHFFVFLQNNLAQKISSDQGWGGEIKNARCQTLDTRCVEDYLMIVEANLGVNKANYFLKRELKGEVEFKENEVLSKMTLLYENTSPANVPPGGVYKNYLRVFLPLTSTLEKVSVGGKNLDLNKEVDRETLFGKTSTGFLVKVLPGEKKTVAVISKLPLTPSWQDLTYQLLVQKQPGTDKDPLSLTFSSAWPMEAVNFPVAPEGGLSYNGDLLVDRIFILKLKK